MKKYVSFIFIILCISFFSLVLAQNETDDSTEEIINLTIECGNGIIEEEEICDNGENNGIPCSVNYGKECTYCSINCESLTIKGDFCGDGKINMEEECDDGNLNNEDTCSNDCKEIMINLDECSSNRECNSDNTNDCIEYRCEGSPKMCEAYPDTGTVYGNKYCENGKLKLKKESGSPCNGDYSCLSGNCDNSQCKEKLNWLVKLLVDIFGEGIKKLFS